MSKKIDSAIEIIMDEKGLEYCERCEEWVSKEWFSAHLNSEKHERGI